MFYKLREEGDRKGLTGREEPTVLVAGRNKEVAGKELLPVPRKSDEEEEGCRRGFFPPEAVVVKGGAPGEAIASSEEAKESAGDGRKPAAVLVVVSRCRPAGGRLSTPVREVFAGGGDLFGLE